MIMGDQCTVRNIIIFNVIFFNIAEDPINIIFSYIKNIENLWANIQIKIII